MNLNKINNNYQNYSSLEDLMTNYNQDRKSKKFFRFAIPILVLEIAALIGLGIWYILLPKNFCTISTNVSNAEIYVNNTKTNKFRFSKTDNPQNIYYFLADLNILIKDTNEYNLTITVECQKYKTSLSTTAAKYNNEYRMTVKGGEKTQFASGVLIYSNEILDNFDVKIYVNLTKV